MLVKLNSQCGSGRIHWGHIVHQNPWALKSEQPGWNSWLCDIYAPQHSLLDNRNTYTYLRQEGEWPHWENKCKHTWCHVCSLAFSPDITWEARSAFELYLHHGLSVQIRGNYLPFELVCFFVVEPGMQVQRAKLTLLRSSSGTIVIDPCKFPLIVFTHFIL